MSHRSSNSLCVCVVAPHAYAAIQPQAGQSIGGLETGAWTLAQGLAELPDTAVTFVVRHSRPLDQQRVGQVNLVPMVEPLHEWRYAVAKCVEMQPRFPWCRLRKWRTSLLWQLPMLAATRPFRDHRPLAVRVAELLRQLQPDVCLGLGTNAVAAEVVRSAQALGSPSLVWLQSNSDLDARCFTDSTYVSPYGETARDCRFVLESATVIICQSRWQQHQLQQYTGRSAQVIRTPVSTELWGSRYVRTTRGEFLLWIGRYDEFHKRPRLAFELARRLPKVPLKMIVNRGDPQLERQLRRDIPPNVQLIDYVPRNELPGLFRQARLFISTGSAEFEGFPKVFLESAASGTPIVSLEDFDDFLARSGAGRSCGGDLDRLAHETLDLWDHEQRWLDCSQNGQRIIASEYGLPTIAAEFRRAMEVAVRQIRR